MSRVMMNFIKRPENRQFDHIIGDAALKGSSLARNFDGEIVEFLVTHKKGPNYVEHCSGLVAATDPVATINKYTDHTTQLFAHVNLSLAADSPAIKLHADYIRDLRSAILSQPLLDDTILYRGVDLSKTEIDEMEALRHFFIPSFSSTSIDREKAYSKSTLMIIKTPFCCKYACSITPELSRFYSTEKEVLLSCYSAYSLEKVEKVNGKTYMTLWLDEFSSGLDKLVY